MKIDIMFGLKILEIFDEICLFEDRKARKVVKIVHAWWYQASLLEQGEEIIFSTSLEKGAFVLPSADGLLMGF